VRYFISIGIWWYLQEFTLRVYEMDYLVGPLREGLDMVPHYHDSLLMEIILMKEVRGLNPFLRNPSPLYFNPGVKRFKADNIPFGF